MNQNSDNNKRKTTPHSQLEIIKIYYDFQLKALTEAANSLAKGLPIYFTILGVLCAYYLTQEVDIQIMRYIVLVAEMISLCLFFAYSFVIFGLIRGLKDLKETLRMADEKLFEKSNISSFVRRGQKGVFIFWIALFLVLGVICIGLLRYRFYLD